MLLMALAMFLTWAVAVAAVQNMEAQIMKVLVRALLCIQARKEI
jgi:hypothetical protein